MGKTDEMRKTGGYLLSGIGAALGYGSYLITNTFDHYPYNIILGGIAAIGCGLCAAGALDDFLQAYRKK